MLISKMNVKGNSIIEAAPIVNTHGLPAAQRVQFLFFTTNHESHEILMPDFSFVRGKNSWIASKQFG